MMLKASAQGCAMSFSLAVFLASPFAGSVCSGAQPDPADRLAAARRLVDDSDKYLHHSHLKRGMKGYGLSVFAGTKTARFEVEIVSVMSKWGPHQDVILARLSGQRLEKTGVISGMSGSPCYVRHEGKDKLIGAVAYGWRAEKEAQCGIQPITQMLATAAIGKATKAPTSGPSPTTEVASGPASVSRFLQIALDPRKRDFSEFAAPARTTVPTGAEAGLVRLSVPLMVSGSGRRATSRLTKALAPMGIVPLQAGGASRAAKDLAGKAKLTPGGAISIPLVTGDANYSTIGTVTDIIGDRVLAFGHSFFGEGEVNLPIGPAYVDTVIANLFGSFKLASDLTITGTLDRDEMVAVSGRIGPSPPMIPMTLQVARRDLPEKSEAHSESYSFNVVRHRYLTSLIVAVVTEDAVWQWRNPPEKHTVAYHLELDFEGLGRYQTANLLSDRDIYPALSDAIRPISALMNNPFAKPPKLERIAIKMQIDKGTLAADIVDLSLDGRIYRPGQTVTGELLVEPYREPRRKLPVSFALPEDLPEGEYALTACDYRAAAAAARSDSPHIYEPRTVKQLFESVKRVVGYRGDQLYLRLPLDRGGVALQQKELPDLPGSRTAVITQADRPDTQTFTRAIVRHRPCRYVLSGKAEAKLELRRRLHETPVTK